MSKRLDWYVEKANMDDVVANSYRDFHVKGLDYICLMRSRSHTVKLYFFDDCDNSDMPEVVCPHDHRYGFSTVVLAGEMTDILYQRDPRGAPMYLYNYRTVLNGGCGFEQVGKVRLSESTKTFGSRMFTINRLHWQIHTICVQRNTVLRLDQYSDELPLHVPTSMYSKSSKPPSLEFMYNKFTPDQINRRLKQIGLPAIA